MTKKETLSAGLANLLSGADQSVKERKAPGQEQQSEAPTMEEGLSASESNLLGTIEDEELRQELERRLYRKRLIGKGRPRKDSKASKPSEGYGRTSLIISLAKWEKLREIALLETLRLKDIVELAFDMVIERYESKHGEIKPQADRKERDIKEIF